MLGENQLKIKDNTIAALQRAVDDSERRASMALEAAGMGIWSVYSLQNRVELDERCQKIYHWPTREMTLDELLQHIHPADLAPIYQAMMRTPDQQTGKPAIIEFRLTSPLDHHTRWIRLTGKAYFNEAGRAYYFTGTAVDISEEKQKEDALRQVEKRFENLITQAPIAIGMLRGENLLVELANDGLLQIWGKSPNVIGKPLLEALPEIRDQPFPDLLKQVYQSGISHYGFETLALLHRNGQLEEAYFNYVYAPIQEGNNKGIIVVANEVTAQVNAKKDLEISEKRFRSLIEEAPMATALYVGRDLVIQLANEPMLKLWGKDGAVVGKKLAEALPELEGQPFLPLLDKVFTSGVTYHTEEEQANLMLDGKLQLYYFNFTYKPLRNAEGEVYAIINMAVDITNRVLARKKIAEAEQELEKQVQRRTEELRKLNVSLQQSNLELERFAYIASHDLQEPLRKVQAFGSIVMDEFGEQLGQRGSELLSRMQASANRMSLLIKDILNFSRTTQHELFVRQVDLNKVIGDVLKDLELLILQKNAQVTCHQLCTVDGIPLQIYQLFYNLISNAIKFSKPGVSPVVTISSRLLTDDEVAQHQSLHWGRAHCEITVTDNGIGFNPNYAQQIFGLFQRLHSKSSYEGTGIGLALCQRIVVNHQGTIWATSKEGKGATFYSIIPVMQADSVVS